MSAPLLVECNHGLGDNINCRPFIRAHAQREALYVSTSWPELYEDLPIKGFVRANTSLRTQLKNLQRQSRTRWTMPPGHLRRARMRYGASELAIGNIYQAYERTLPLGGAPLVMDLPNFGPCPVKADRSIAVVRPVTVRQEWRNEARNPAPEYVAEACAILRELGHHIVSIADVQPNAEWFVGSAPPADTVLHRGELTVRPLLALIQHAAVVVGGVGWILPACLAARTPLVLIAGGQGGHNAPRAVLDDRIDSRHVRWIFPENYCRDCTNMLHQCDKRIDGFAAKFSAALQAAPEMARP